MPRFWREWYWPHAMLTGKYREPCMPKGFDNNPKIKRKPMLPGNLAQLPISETISRGMGTSQEPIIGPIMGSWYKLWALRFLHGIIWVGKRYLWLVNSFLEDHQPIITNACLVYPNDPRSHCAQSLHPFSVGQFLNWEVYEMDVTKLSKHNLFSGLSSPQCQPLHWRWAVWPRYVSLLSFGKD